VVGLAAIERFLNALSQLRIVDKVENIALHDLDALGARSPLQGSVRRCECDPVTHRQFKISRVICRQSMLPAKILRGVKYGPRCGRIDFSRQAFQVFGKSLDQFLCQPLSLLAHQKGVKYFVTPESRHGGLSPRAIFSEIFSAF
jgi:hypothetical protein